MNVLINAYACSPFRGSEPGMGWNWISNLAKYCNLFVITEGEWKSEIEHSILSHPYKDHLHFYYLPVSETVRKMCWNQGDWRFYYYYREWQKRAFKKAEEIILNEQIDIIHQLNMLGFREPGYLWKIDKPLVWGPIGGMGEIPINYLESASLRIKVSLFLKKTLSDLQLRYSNRVNNAFQKASVLISAVPITQTKILSIKGRESILINETGCCELEKKAVVKRNQHDFNVLWVGRFIFTKRLDIALKTIALIKELPQIRLHIVGGGTKDQEQSYYQLCKKLGIDNICEWHGVVKNEEVHRLMRQSDVFFFTSIAEATSTVVPEAITNGLPVVCHDTCGFGPIINDKIGRKIEMVNPKESVCKFAKVIKDLYNHRAILDEMSNNCQEAIRPLLWENKAKRVFDIYQTVLNEKKV